MGAVARRSSAVLLSAGRRQAPAASAQSSIWKAEGHRERLGPGVEGGGCREKGLAMRPWLAIEPRRIWRAGSQPGIAVVSLGPQMSDQVGYFHALLRLEGLRDTKLAAQSVQIVCVRRRQGLPWRDTVKSCKA